MRLRFLLIAFILFTVPVFTYAIMYMDNKTLEKSRHPFLKDENIYYTTGDGEEKEIEFAVLVLSKPINKCFVPVDKTGYWIRDRDKDRLKEYIVKYVPCYPEFEAAIKLIPAKITISKLLARVDNCTIVDFNAPNFSEITLGYVGDSRSIQNWRNKENEYFINLIGNYIQSKTVKCGSYPQWQIKRGGGRSYIIGKKEKLYLTE